MRSAAFWQQNMSRLLQAIEFSHSLLQFCKASKVRAGSHQRYGSIKMLLLH
jgi:hypothetical protein